MSAGAPDFSRSYNASDRTISAKPKNTYISRLVEKTTICLSTFKATFWVGSVMLRKSRMTRKIPLNVVRRHHHMM
jgi:hypothetical protein